MLPKHLLLAALAAAILPCGAAGLSAHPATVSRHQSRFGPWRLTIIGDDFTGGKICRLSAPHLAFERDTLIVQLPSRIDTMNAVYRIDDGPPVRASQEDALLAERGFAFRADNLRNPSGGVVRIPSEHLKGAKQVRVEAVVGKISAFELTGLQAGMDAYTAAGCN